MIDTDNKFMVAAVGDDALIMNSPRIIKRIPRSDALNLAAWIVAMFDRDDEFAELLKAVQNT